MNVSHLNVTLANRLILADFSAQFPAGQVSCLVGPNGCGKTTLLRTLAGLIPARSGQAELNGQDLLTADRRQRALRLAYLPQSRPVPQIRAGLLIEHGRFPHEGFSKRLDSRGRQAMEEAMALTNTTHLANRFLPELSGGERQRIYLAAALAQETEVLLLDEPTTFLDLRYQLELLELCRTLAQQGKTVVLVLHDLLQAFTCADTVCVMDKGQCAACAPAKELLGHPLLGEIFGYDLLPGDFGIYTCRLARRKDSL